SGSPALGVPDAAATLAEVRRRGILTAPAGGDPERFTLTEVTRRYVRRRLALPESEVATLRRAAAACHAERGEVADAVRYLLQLGDGPGLAELLERHGRELLAAGNAALVLTAAEGIGAADRTPTVDLLEVQAYQVRGDWDRAVTLLTRLVPADGPVPPEVAWRLGLIHHLRGELPQALAVYRRGLATPDGGADATADLALCAAWGAGAAWLCGEVDEARRLVERAEDLLATSRDHAALAAVHTAKAMLAALDGDRHANDAHYLRALEHAEQAGDLLQQIRTRTTRGSHFLAGRWLTCRTATSTDGLSTVAPAVRERAT
ncbi:MAG: hypothetical protein FWJ87_10095, partial [Micromonosporaceae bacterium]